MQPGNLRKKEQLSFALANWAIFVFEKLIRFVFSKVYKDLIRLRNDPVR